MPFHAALLPVALAVPQAKENFRSMSRGHYAGDGINTLILNTLKVHFALEVLLAASLAVGTVHRRIIL